MKAIIKVVGIDEYDYERGGYSQIIEEFCMEVWEKELQELTTWTPGALLSYMMVNCVGKCSTVAGEANYYIPTLKIGELVLSLQANYYLWKYRYNNHTPNEKLVTKDEFNAVCDVDTFIDVRITIGKDIELCMGQMTLQRISAFLFDLGMNLSATIKYRP